MTVPRIWGTLDPFIENGPVLGRIQANAGFLDGLLGLDPYDIYRFYPPSRAACASLAQALEQARPDMWAAGRLQVVPRDELPGRLAREDHHVFHLSDCIVHPGHLAAARNAWSRQIFPVTSVTHSLSYARYGLEMLRHLGPCTTPRDAVVATSRTAARVVSGFFDFLREGYALSPEAFPEPSVEVIPLGVDLASYAPAGQGEREQLRARLGFGSETVFLVLARLCHSSKMDFLPILRAFQRAALGRTSGPLRLALAGWTDEGDWGRGTIEDLARNIGLELSVFERPSEELKRRLYAAADVFLSPSDNLQETFGLTLLEAQACGLPVIASDFDGYRDLVSHGQTGLLIPTAGPAHTGDVDVAAPMAFDNHTHLVLAQRLAVDVAALAKAVKLLAADPALRTRMGRAALRKASGYGWSQVAGAYVRLWEELRARPVPRAGAARHPAAIPYSRVFGSYPTRTLARGARVRASRFGNAVYRRQDFPVVYEAMAGRIGMDAVRATLVVARKAVDAADLLVRLRAAVPGLGEEDAEALALWCLKHDLLEFCDD